MGLKWTELIVGQLEFYWDVHLRPRVEGLTDDEYFWEPVPGMWSVRRDDSGHWVQDWAWPVPQPEPMTTIAWRMMHIAATGLSNRAGAFFGEDPFPDVDMNDPTRYPANLPNTAADAVAYLDEAYAAWMAGISALDEQDMARKLGPKGGQYADDTMAGLIVHINREVMHHGGEIGVLRDLYARRSG
jgi:DinB superfamily